MTFWAFNGGWQVIDTIIFDLGGVLYDIDPELTTQALAKCGFALQPGEFDSTDRRSAIDQFERGTLSTEGFVAMIQARSTQSVSDEAIHEACCALMLGFTLPRIRYCQSLAKEYRLFLLSNTNPMHISFAEAQLREQFGINGLAELFIKPYLSYEMGLRKPEHAIYQRVIEEQSLDPAKTIFVDDTQVNVESAKACGLHAWHKPREIELCDAMPEVLSCLV